MADGYAPFGGGDGFDEGDDAARMERADASASRALKLAAAVIAIAFTGAAGTAFASRRLGDGGLVWLVGFAAIALVGVVLAYATVNGVEGIVRGSKRGRTLGIVALVVAASGVLGGCPLGCSAGGGPSSELAP